ncbi:MAG: hypothetical protein N4A47_04215 [Clostridia bacterium]|nr:hypothetical protein [Clostridia bacterium]
MNIIEFIDQLDDYIGIEVFDENKENIRVIVDAYNYDDELIGKYEIKFNSLAYYGEYEGLGAGVDYKYITESNGILDDFNEPIGEIWWDGKCTDINALTGELYHLYYDYYKGEKTINIDFREKFDKESGFLPKENFKLLEKILPTLKKYGIDGRIYLDSEERKSFKMLSLLDLYFIAEDFIITEKGE